MDVKCFIALALLLVASSAKQTRIIGGSEVSSCSVPIYCCLACAHVYILSLTNFLQTDEDRYPYAVALTKGNKRFFCGGSLIARDVVLTAGVSSLNSLALSILFMSIIHLIWSVTFVHTQSIAWEANTM